MSKKLKVPDYCSQQLGFYKVRTFEEVIKRLEELSQKYPTDVFDEVVVNVSLGRNCNDQTRCQSCIFRRRRSKRI